MGFFGFKSAKEVEEEKRKAAAAGAQSALNQQKASLSNQARGSQTRFRIPYFDAFDPRTETGVPVAVGVTIVYSIEDMASFLQMNAMQTFNEQVFNDKLKSGTTKFVKSVVSNAPSDAGIPLVQIERKIEDVSELVQAKVITQVERTYGIKVRALDVTDIDIDKDSRGYRELKAKTSDLDDERRMAQHKMSMSNMQLQHETEQSNFRLQNSLNQSNMTLQNTLNQDQLKMQSSLNLDAMKRQQEMTLGGQEEMQKMQLEMQRLQSVDTLKMQMENQRETMRIQREEMQRASKLQTEQTFLGAHQANLNAGVINNATDCGINAFKQQQQPMGGGMFGQNTLGGGMPQMPGMPQMGGMPQMNAPKAVPQVQYMVGVNGQPAGPFDWNQLQQLVQGGQLTQQSQVWKQGMQSWAMAGQVPELQPLFVGQAPAMGGMPGMPSM